MRYHGAKWLLRGIGIYSSLSWMCFVVSHQSCVNYRKEDFLKALSSAVPAEVEITDKAQNRRPSSLPGTVAQACVFPKEQQLRWSTSLFTIIPHIDVNIKISFNYLIK